MPRHRRLLITHAGELAHRLVRAVRPHGMVAEFAASYARQHHRKGVVDEPNRLRELEATLGREAILVMTAEVLRLLPAALGARKGHTLAPEEAALAAMFVPEFRKALVRSLDWRAEDFESEQENFDRDLRMYQHWIDRQAAARGIADLEGTSPFLDRCALLLDPPTMEQARQAAEKFERELVKTAASILGRLGLLTAGAPGGRRASRQSRRQKPPGKKSREAAGRVKPRPPKKVMAKKKRR